MKTAKIVWLVETNANQVISVVKCFNTKPSAGYDDIPNDIIKLSIILRQYIINNNQ